ncbi:MAG: isoprenylcysteine carboxylmethyltransferase family protein [Desulfamplus sp.]|nr:isoprenylcysteine carboxylmethyltransferase family protein [Desulfamplus sp.]
MKFLELKIPPVLVFFLTIAVMWALSLISNELGADKNIRFLIGAVLILIGGLIIISGVLGFRKARTTVNPVKPYKASSLVCSGIYSYTRNPMYTGLFFVLVAWGCFLDNIFSLLFVFVFLLYMTRFQIKPEERVLESIFGKDYRLYKEQVRRWL